MNADQIVSEWNRQVDNLFNEALELERLVSQAKGEQRAALQKSYDRLRTRLNDTRIK